MAGDGKDWTEAAVIASGQVQQVGGSQHDKFQGSAGAAAATLAPTAGRTVLQWTIKNEGDADLDVWLGAESGAAAMRLSPGESWSPAFNGALVVKRVTVDVAYRAAAVEV